MLAASSFLGGAVEAAFLVVVTRTALAVADGRERLGALAGQRLSITEAVALGAGLLAARLALSLVGVRTSSTITVDVTTETRRSLADAYLRASWATQQAERSGRLHELLMSFAGQVAGIVGSVTTSITSVLNLAALLLVSVVINPVATAVVAGSLLVLGTVLSPMRRHIRARGRRAAAAQLSFAESISELGAMAMEMQAYGVRDQFAERIRELIDRDAEARRGVVVLQGSLTPVYTTLAYAALLGGIALASTLVQGELGGIAAVMLVMLRSLSYGQQAQAAAGGLGATLPYLDVIDETLARYRAEPALMGTEPISDVGDIELNEVAFAYTPGQDVLHDLSFTIAAREVVGVIGPSGSGKSTLVQLLLGVREPTAGRICLGGTPLHQVDRQALAHLVAFVGQEPLLLSGPVADSIAFYRSDIDREQVERAAERAHVAGELREMPAGFETPAGERGSRLSGGQRQRVSIARALAGRPRLLVLDEPTSALDNRSEALIRQTIAELKGSATIVIIAHRLSTLEVCDRILVLEHGHVRAFDSREALARDNSFFQEALAFSGLSG